MAVLTEFTSEFVFEKIFYPESLLAKTVILKDKW